MVTLQRIAVLLSTLLIISCVGPDTSRHVELPALTWPGGDEIQRIQFINVVSTPFDIGITPSFFEQIWNVIAGEPDEFIVSPYGVETDQRGRLYVVDTYLKSVHVFDVTRREYFTFDTANTVLQSPIDLAIDAKRNKIYVTDSSTGIVRIFNTDGEILAGGIGKDILERPTGIAVNQITEELLVIDTKKSVVYQFDLNSNLLKGYFGTNGTGDGQFNYPTNIFVKRDGTIFVTDSLNFRVQIFSEFGEFIGKFGSAGDSPGFFSKPKGVAVDSDENIYVVDSLHDTVQMFNQDGELLMDFGRSGNQYGKFWLPSGIFIDSDDFIYVSDTYNKRIQIFQYMKNKNVQASGPEKQ